MESTNYLETTKIKWSQILSLAFLNAIVVFSWIAYNNYQPKILVKFNFQELSLFLAITQALVMVFIPPLAGKLGDILAKRNTNNFLVFTLGISITAMVFMAVAFMVGGDLFSGWRYILPFLIIVWLISMNIFISPANSMIELFAPPQQLPIVMGVLVVVTELTAALEPSIIILIDALGSTYTFLGGGVLIAIAGFYFKKTTQNLVLNQDKKAEPSDASNFILVVFVGLVLGAITGILMNVFPTLLASKLHFIIGNSAFANYFVSGILALSALMAIPLSKWAEKYGSKNGVIWGLLGSIFFVGIVFLTSSTLCLLACMALAVFYSLASVSTFPFALEHLNSRQVSYGTGIFIGATEVIDQLLNIWLL